ncbi:MAG: hypothetical protein Q4P25_02225 [Tissierellia bacterium]|nr:hypothetical protein [Tissierellia bacterium]
MDHFIDSSSKYCEDVTLSYNGVNILMETSLIPEAIRKFVKLGIDIYGVYELYEPK